MLDFAGQLQDQGVRNYPQVSPRTLDIHVNWDGGMSWFALENSWHKMVQAPRPEKEPMLRDPQWRALAREEWDRVPRTMIPHKPADRIRLVSVTRPENERWVGATLADLVADRGGHPSDVLADWLLENDADAGIVGVGVANSDAGGVAETLTHPASVMANSDAGAHPMVPRLASGRPAEDDGLREMFVERFPEVLPRAPRATIQQAMLLANSEAFANLFKPDPGTAAAHIGTLPTPENRVREAFQTALLRSPDAEELAKAIEFLNSRADRPAEVPETVPADLGSPAAAGSDE